MSTQTTRNIFVASVFVSVFAVTFHKSMQQQLIAAYPFRDPKLVRKAYNQMLLEGLRGNLIGEKLTNDFLDKLFDTKYYQLANK